MEIFLPTPQTNRTESFARNNAMVDDYIAGKTLKDIGKKYGITCERVRQIISRAKYLAWKTHQIDVEAMRCENL